MLYDPRPIHMSLAQEAIAAFADAIVERTRDMVQVDLGPPEEGTILLLFIPDALEVRFRVVEWPHPHTPVLGSRLWKRVKYERVEAAKLLKLVRDAERAWTHRQVQCHHCERKFSPERTIEIHGRVCCHGCAERHEHVVF